MSGHISITVNSTEYPLIIDPNSYSEVDIVDFAPRAGGSLNFAELGLYLDIAQENFQHGFGKWIFNEGQSYAYTGTQVDTRHGHISLYTKPNSLGTIGTGVPTRIITHRNTPIFATNSNNVFTVDAAGSGTVSLLAGYSIRDLLTTGTYVLAAQIGSTQKLQLFDIGQSTGAGVGSVTVSASQGWDVNVWQGGTVVVYEGTGAGQAKTVASNTANTLTPTVAFSPALDSTSKIVVNIDTGSVSNPAHNFAKLEVFGGFFWGYENNTNFLHFWSEVTGSDAEGHGTTDPAVIQIGNKATKIRNILAFNNQLWVFKDDGAWVVGEDNLAYHTLNYASEQSTLNFQSIAVWAGFLIFPIRNSVYKYRSGLQNITPPHWDELPPYKQFGNFKGFTTAGDWFYMVGQSNVANATDEPATESLTGFASLMASDGVGWHKLLDIPVSNAVDYWAGLDPINNYLYVSARESGGNSTLYRIPQQALSSLPYADFDTAATANFYTSYFDLGFKRIPKSFASVTLSGEFPTNTSVVVEYRVDDTTTWTTLGTFTTELQETAFPTATTGKRIQLRLRLVTTSASVTPIVRAIILKVMVRPDVLYGVNCNVIISSGLQDQRRGQLGLSAAQIRDALQAARSSVAPITFKDVFGVSHSAYLSSLRILTQQYENETNIETIARCTFVYVG